MAVSDSVGFISRIKLIPELEVDYAIDAIGGSESAYEAILMRIVHLIPSNIEQMDAFSSAGNDLRDFGVRVHGVKSSLRQAGNLRLAQYAEELEEAAKEGNKSYCEEYYVTFREELLSFFDKVNDVFSQCKASGGDLEVGNECDSNIYDFFDILAKVKTAAETYDTMSASELLLPLTKRRFGGNTDKLIAKAMEELYIFKPRKALEYLDELAK